ncbi:MAG: dynamin family protein [Bacillota bacterium]
MGLCCHLEADCQVSNNIKMCSLSENERQALFDFKEKFLRLIATSSRIHNIPADKLNEFKKDSEDLKRLFYGMYYLSNIIFDSDDEQHQQAFNKLFVDMENAFVKIIKRAQLRSITMGKHAVGFFGHFNSGKSSMLNRILSAEFKLPVDNKPSTAVPTYITYSKTDKLIFENMKGRVSEVNDMSVLEKIKHSEHPCGFPWASVINRIYCFCKKVNNPNVVYIDLPGISNDESDNEKAYNDVAGCDGIVYLIPQNQGSLTDQDIECLQKITQYSIPILIVLTKVDSVPPKKSRNIYDKIKNDLSEHSIPYENFIMYSITPEKLEKFDQKFYNELLESQNIIDEFINKPMKIEDDLEEIRSYTGYMYNRFDEADDHLRALAKEVNAIFEAFEGQQELTKSFFDRWEAIEKQIYVSDQNYLSKGGFFSNPEFNTGSFVKSISPVIDSYFNKETEVYSSLFNWSFIQLGHLSTLQYLWEVACIVTANLKTVSSDSFDREQKYIHQVQKNYNTIKDNLDHIHQQSLRTSIMLIEELSKMQEKVGKYWNEFKGCYVSLIELSKQNHKEWSE